MNDDKLHRLLRAHESAGQPRFESGFADRVMQRVAGASSDGAVTLDFVLAHYARRVLPAVAAASMMLALWNYVSVRDRAPSTVSAVLGVATSNVAGSGGVSTNGLVNAEVFE